MEDELYTNLNMQSESENHESRISNLEITFFSLTLNALSFICRVSVRIISPGCAAP